MKYTTPSYEEMIKNSYCYNLQDHSSHEWTLVRRLYYKNYLRNKSDQPLIPKKIHQIWLGGKMPDKFKKYVDTWTAINPTWEYRLWGNDDVDKLVVAKKDLFNSVTNIGQKSDILRYEILRRFGGIYVDTDFECLRPLDDFLYLKFFAGVAYDREMVVYNGMVGCIPEHPIMATCVEGQQETYVGNDGQKIMKTTGAYYLTECILANAVNDTDGIVLFPMAFFYPFPNNMRHTNDAHKYIQECTYAVHYWKTSWLLP